MPSPKRNPPAEAADLQEYEELQKRFKHLETERTRAETRLEEARKKLEELQKEARKQWGTDDLDALRKKLTTMQAENEKKLRDYQAALDGIEAGLKKIEESLEGSDKAGA